MIYVGCLLNDIRTILFTIMNCKWLHYNMFHPPGYSYPIGHGHKYVHDGVECWCIRLLALNFLIGGCFLRVRVLNN